MNDEDALFEADALLFAIANVAGGYVSRSQRERIAALHKYIHPRLVERNQRLIDGKA